MQQLRRRCVIVAAVLATALAMAFAPVPPPKPRRAPTAEEELKRLQGTWQLAGAVVHGVRGGVSPDAYWVIKGDLATEHRAGTVAGRWRLALDPSKSPKAIDLKEDRGNSLLPGVYELEGDTLTLCYGSLGRAKGRPADLKARRDVCIEVLRRAKKKP
jgi:uncharacterized protein (TIGR03067 family)